MSEITDTPDCCDTWPRIVWVFQWMKMEGMEIVTLPHIQAPNEQIKYKANYCPSCGADRRGLMMDRKRLAAPKEGKCIL